MHGLTAEEKKVVLRIDHDLQTKYRDYGISVEKTLVDGNQLVFTLSVGDIGNPAGWGTVTIVFEDGLDPDALTIALLEEILSNLWPDDDIDPWPVCRSHPEQGLQLLQPAMYSGKAYWMCPRDSGHRALVGTL